MQGALGRLFPLDAAHHAQSTSVPTSLWMYFTEQSDLRTRPAAALLLLLGIVQWKCSAGCFLNGVGGYECKGLAGLAASA